jgi:hypothetical protein
MRQWVEQQLDLALSGRLEQKRSQPTPSRALPAATAPVQKKRLPEAAPETGDEPWSRPPFWAGRSERRSA